MAKPPHLVIDGDSHLLLKENKIPMLNKLLQEVDTLKDELINLKQTRKPIRNLEEDFHIRYIYNSNAIEGNTLTLKETKVVLEGITIGGKSLREHFEVINHAEAINYIEDMVKNKEPLSESHIKSIHSLILKNINNENVGRYRNEDVVIKGANHKPPSYIFLNEEMEKFIKWYESDKNLHPLLKSAKVHVDIVGIHPFIDGNGRLSRLLMNLELLKSDYLSVCIEKDKRLDYYEALDTAHCDNDYNPFYQLICEYEIKRLKEVLKLYDSK